VQCPGDQLLAGTALAHDQDRHVGSRDLASQLEDGLHDGAGRDDLRELLAPRQPGLQADVLHGKPPLLEGAANHDVELGYAARLGEIIVGSEFHRGDSRLDCSVAGYDHDLRWGVELHSLAQNADAVDFRHHQVYECHVELGGS
jgi:hypothetical protein